MRIDEKKGILIFGIIAAVVVIISIICVIASNFNSDAKMLVGTWKGVQGNESTLTLNSDGTFHEENYASASGIGFNANFKGTYTLDVKEKRIKMHPDDDSELGNNKGNVWEYSYVISDNFLTLENVGSLFEGPKSYTKK
jgi:hypothetical protein